MSRHAWLTPDDAPGTALCRTVFIPVGLQYEAAFRGAYLLLCDPDNWEETGTQTPETCADAFQAAFFETLENWEECPVGGLIVGEVRTLIAYPPPDGWLFCDGAVLLIADYPALYDAIGNAFGGNGTTTFALPDLQGRFVVGYGYGSGLSEYLVGDTGGEERHELVIDELPAHDHTINHAHELTGVAEPAVLQSGTNRIALRDGQETNWPVSAHSGNSGDAGSGYSHENRPPYIALAHYIYAGV